MNNSAYIKKIYCCIKKVWSFIVKNQVCLDNTHVVKNTVNLEWVDNGNLGDSLGPIIYKWMLQKNNLSEHALTQKTYHLFTCGSLIGVGKFDVVVWGSGIHSVSNIRNLLFMKRLRKQDIRAVRGPISRQILLDCGYVCPEIYGDPAIIMPLIYDEITTEKKYNISVILHYSLKDDNEFKRKDCHYINIGTTDYKAFIRQIKESEKVISSSLHGIILSETYGTPAVFLNTGGYVDKALMKYYDWYYSTNRWSVKMAKTIEEAIEMEPMPLPDLTEMRNKLMDVFPFDLWV